MQVSGLGGTAEEAQEEVLVGVGVLAGSTIMILTVAWGGALIAGRCDLAGPGGTAVDRTTTLPYSLTETGNITSVLVMAPLSSSQSQEAEAEVDVRSPGVTTDEQTRWGAWIMVATLLPYLVLQIPLLDGQQDTQGHTAALVAMILSFLGLIAYCVYQVGAQGTPPPHPCVRIWRNGGVRCGVRWRRPGCKR